MVDENPPRPADPAPGSRSRVRRLAERASYDRETIHAILDEGLVCHLGFCDGNQPVVLPTSYARVGESILLHGAVGNHALRTLSDGAQVCLTVTLLDGLVLARSTFHHSINYRSVVVFGTATEVVDDREKLAALAALVEHMVPGRSADARPPSASELRSTKVLRVDIAEASAKVRRGGPVDDPEDLDHLVWAGELALPVVPGPLLPDSAQAVLVAPPTYLTAYSRLGRSESESQIGPTPG